MSDTVLPIRLTVGWPTTEENLTAKTLHTTVQANTSEQSSYQEELKRQLDQSPAACIAQLDQLLRRRTGGFADINRFTGALLDVWKDYPTLEYCSIDIFAYAFLKHAKNYDLFMQPEPESLNNLKETIKDWQRAVQALEDFERLGVGLASEYSHLEEVYLRLRTMVSRVSARDEQRTLAALLVCGPLTREEISSDLGLNYSLNQRILAALQATGVIDSRLDGGDTRYLISKTAVPVTLFVVREIIGLDLLAMTAEFWKEH